jgi:5-formyltetrahydrofolate cyclo-ligase
VADLAPYQAAQVIHSYLAIRSEVDTQPLILSALEVGKRVVVPIVQRDDPTLGHSWLTSVAAADMAPGVFGTWQPRNVQPALPGDWQLVIVPLLAFDRQGYRLGYGKGYYDRLLEAAPTGAVGVAFAAQEVAAVPHETHDRRLHYIVTEHEVLQPAEHAR